MREKTDLQGVQSIAKHLLMVDLHLTDYSPLVVHHPFTSSGMVAVPSEKGIRLIDITKDRKDLKTWQDYMIDLIDNTKSAFQIYMMTNKPYSLTFLKFAKPYLSQDDFSQILANAWIRSENPNLDANFTKEKLLEMFKEADPQVLMDDKEREQLKELDDIVTIYRGVTSYNEKNNNALSWTLDYKTAEWFAHRFNEDGTVYEAQIPKEHIYALFNGRNESEVIVDPKYIRRTLMENRFGFYEELDMRRKVDPDARFGFLRNFDVTSESSAFSFLHGNCEEFAAILSDMYGCQ